MEVVLKIQRQQPGEPTTTADFTVEISEGSTVLDALTQAKWSQDGTLAFRCNCRNTICGSCAMGINGRSALACGSRLSDETQHWQGDGPPEITLTPLNNLPVIRDLVVDMQPFWQKLKGVSPAMAGLAKTPDQREVLQTPEARTQLDQVSNCIQCGACYSECNSVMVNPQFPGPHAMAKAYRMVTDSRSIDSQTRLAQLNDSDGLWGCTRCQQCTTVCPMEVAPMEQISRLKREILSQSTGTESRAIRHRKQLIRLVKEGGWIDERKFGLRVVGNSGRDLAGLASLVPLGLQMLQKGKFPGKFEASEGAREVRSLIESVQTFEAQQ
jgi:succinate dehydrogenase / fumarate reductase, iron-sulfur subunit